MTGTLNEVRPPEVDDLEGASTHMDGDARPFYRPSPPIRGRVVIDVRPPRHQCIDDSLNDDPDYVLHKAQVFPLTAVTSLAIDEVRERPPLAANVDGLSLLNLWSVRLSEERLELNEERFIIRPSAILRPGVVDPADAFVDALRAAWS